MSIVLLVRLPGSKPTHLEFIHNFDCIASYCGTSYQYCVGCLSGDIYEIRYFIGFAEVRREDEQEFRHQQTFNPVALMNQLCRRDENDYRRPLVYIHCPPLKLSRVLASMCWPVPLMFDSVALRLSLFHQSSPCCARLDYVTLCAQASHSLPVGLMIIEFRAG